MKDRNGARVCKGDRVLVFSNAGVKSEPLGYAAISRIDACGCSICQGCMVAAFVRSHSIGMKCARSDAIELPVAVAVARRRESEAGHDR